MTNELNWNELQARKATKPKQLAWEDRERRRKGYGKRGSTYIHALGQKEMAQWQWQKCALIGILSRWATVQLKENFCKNTFRLFSHPKCIFSYVGKVFTLCKSDYGKYIEQMCASVCVWACSLFDICLLWTGSIKNISPLPIAIKMQPLCFCLFLASGFCHKWRPQLN